VIVEADALPAASSAIGVDEGRRLWIEEMDFDPRPVFGQARVPTLLFYGEDDAWTPVAASIEGWPQARGDDVEPLRYWQRRNGEASYGRSPRASRTIGANTRSASCDHFITSPASGCGDSTTDRGSARGHF
jgi:hypothetical protein